MPLSSWEMGGLSEESGANFDEFIPRLRIADCCVTDFLAGGSSWNLLSVYLSLDDRILSLNDS